MVGPGSQLNKAHKAGRRAGRSARDKHRDKKDAAQRVGIKTARSTQNKAERLNAAKQQRDKKRAQVLEARRTTVAPRLIALLPLSADVDVKSIWQGLLQACQASEPAPATAAASKTDEMGMDIELPNAEGAPPMQMQTLSLPDRRRLRFTFLPPPSDLSDPLAIVDVGRAAEVILLLLPGGPQATPVDTDGAAALSVLRALGLPPTVGLVQAPHAAGGQAGLKERSAAKKRASEALLTHLNGEHRVMPVDLAADFKQVLRHLADSAHSVPHWRRHRPQLIPDAAQFLPDAADPTAGTLLLSGYVRGLGLSANQLLHVPTAGDFQIAQIDGLPEPACANEAVAGSAARRPTAGAVAMEEEGSRWGGGASVLARPDPAQQEALVRENDADPLDAEQTWPTEEELRDAEAEAKARRRRLPKGTSEYQAAWILDDFGDVGASASDDDSVEDGSLPDLAPNGAVASASEDEEGAWGMEDAGTEVNMEFDEGEQDPSQALAELRARRAAEEEDARFPDEVETPLDVAARQRFARYRGLKSFRTSPWDPREELPADYARVFAFENLKRAHKRAREAALKVGGPEDVHGVAAATYVQVYVAAVPADVALRVVERVGASASGAAPPLSAFGLLQHECKLSVLNFSMHKVGSYAPPVANKEELLFVTGLRSYLARPILSTDATGAEKHKMERFLHPGQNAVGTVYAPISHPPLPLLAFKLQPGGQAVLAATGSLRDCNPDRVVLKKIVLTGYPVRVHKAKAVVRFMFHSPDDVRWFRPVELWTKHGRRGRIREPVGMHGTMKAIFDGSITQQDAVCMSLYKRVYPKWPGEATFA